MTSMMSMKKWSSTRCAAEELCEYLGLAKEIAPEAALLEFAALHRRHRDASALHALVKADCGTAIPIVMADLDLSRGVPEYSKFTRSTTCASRTIQSQITSLLAEASMTSSATCIEAA